MLLGVLVAAAALAQVAPPPPPAPGQAPPRRVMPGTVDPEKKAEQEKPKPTELKDSASPVDSEQLLFRDSVTYVLVPTTVTDGHGKVINGLKPQDFELFDNGKVQQINRDVAFLPLSMVICIQRSANVEKMLPNIKKMGNLMRDMLVGQDGEAAIISFDHRIQLLQDFTNDADRITAALATLAPGGNNNRLNDATQQAIRLLRAKKDRRKVILLISETVDRSSEARPMTGPRLSRPKTGRLIQENPGSNPVHQITLATSSTRPSCSTGKPSFTPTTRGNRSIPACSRCFDLTRISGVPFCGPPCTFRPIGVLSDTIR